ncbi:MAG: ATP-dependent Zn protease [Okeania sp. SIO2F4]|uniref:ATP-dependent Zn protease n=1 Tax=Okeania sp. SIO2F4 TaxID=2607790 RepID=UPI00142A971F|nr:ATP-dependent Zn protease [Okeania sp. SIO2F4]NES03083.1 ATP-dependent Zn protease [Okeania sp. SIO2F4]
MKQTSLNIIAIGIFVLTMSALLGPIFNVSPLIPAIATFSVLVLATIDTLGWQGQGGMIIVDLVEGTSSERRDRIICHEAGHFLVAYLLEIPVSGYALSAWEAFRQGQSAQGGVRFDDQKLAAQLQKGIISDQLVDRYCTVWMAGIAAEDLVYGNAEGGAEDRAKITAILTQLKRPGESKLKQSWASLQARSLLENHQSAYKALVEAMTERASVSDCYQAIHQHLSVHQN